MLRQQPWKARVAVGGGQPHARRGVIGSMRDGDVYWHTTSVPVRHWCIEMCSVATVTAYAGIVGVSSGPAHGGGISLKVAWEGC